MKQVQIKTGSFKGTGICCLQHHSYSLSLPSGSSIWLKLANGAVEEKYCVPISFPMLNFCIK